MRWKLAILIAVTGALLFVVIAPLTSMSVHVALPPADHPMTADEAQRSARGARTAAWGIVWFAEAAMITVVLGGAGLIARRIIRRGRKAT